MQWHLHRTAARTNHPDTPTAHINQVACVPIGKYQCHRQMLTSG